MNYKLLPALLFGFLSFTSPNLNTTESPLLAENTTVTFESKVNVLYQSLKTNNFKLPNIESFSNALEGFHKLQQKGLIRNNILTLIDFSLSSNVKRLWVIDMNSNTILYNSLVAHGRNSGDEFATQFSNKSESFQSSLGFYLTGEVYHGKHGESLRLDGMEHGINDKARDRAVVMHGADYVSDSFIKQNKRLGRSLGCPALPQEITAEIIALIKDQSCLYIYHPTVKYKASSKLIS